MVVEEFGSWFDTDLGIVSASSIYLGARVVFLSFFITPFRRLLPGMYVCLAMPYSERELHSPLLVFKVYPPGNSTTFVARIARNLMQDVFLDTSLKIDGNSPVLSVCQLS